MLKIGTATTETFGANMSISAQAIRIYATLEALKEKGSDDVIDSLVPFTFPILEVANEKVYDPNLLIVGLKKLYGWQINTDVAAEFTRRLEKKGFIKRPDNSKANIMIVHFDLFSDAKFEGSIATELNAVIAEFKNFVEEFSDLIHYNRSDDDLLGIIYRFLVDEGIRSNHDVGAIGEEYRQIVQQLELSRDPLNNEDRYICARFIEHLFEIKSNYIDTLASISSIGMLVEVVQDFNHPVNVPTNSDTVFYLDAPLAMDLLGVSGESAKKDVELVVKALRKLGCNIRVFEVSCDEIAHVLKSLFSTQKGNRTGPTHMAIIRQEVDEEYVKLVMRDPERFLTNLDINQSNSNLNLFPNTHQYFDSQRYEDFLSRINWKQDSMEARRHDATCMAMICRLRAGQKNGDLFRNNFVFVTRNRLFSGVAKRFAVENALVDSRHVGPVVHMSEVATNAWLRTGFSEATQIPLTHLISHCERILAVRKEVIEKAKEVLSRVRPDRRAQLEALLQDSRSSLRLMDATFGNENLITGENIEALLEEMRRATAEEERKAFEAQRNADRAEHAMAMRKLRQEYKKSVEEKEDKISNLANSLDELRNKEYSKDIDEKKEIESILYRINRSLRAIEYILGIGLMFIGLLSIIFMISKSGESNTFIYVSYFIISAIGIGQIVQTFRNKEFIGLKHILNYMGKQKLKNDVRELGLLRSRHFRSIRWKDGRGYFDPEL